MIFRQLIDYDTYTYSYLIADSKSKSAVLVDSVKHNADHYLKLLKELELTLLYCVETHIHADHITAAKQLKQKTNCQIIIPAGVNTDCADRFIQDQEQLVLGEVIIKALSTPGHTKSHMAYLINQTLVLTGDALLIRGCGRTDFQDGNAATLYQSIQDQLFSLADDILVYPAHDYNGNTCSTIGEEKDFNPRLANKSCTEFIAIMQNLDLPKPQQIDIAVPANLRCGENS